MTMTIHTITIITTRRRRSTKTTTALARLLQPFGECAFGGRSSGGGGGITGRIHTGHGDQSTANYRTLIH